MRKLLALAIIAALAVTLYLRRPKPTPDALAVIARAWSAEDPEWWGV